MSNIYILAKKHQDAVKKEEDLFRLLLFFPIILLSQEIYLLPDDADRLMYAIDGDIKNAKREVFIFSAYIDDYNLIQSLKTLSKQNIPVTIISKSPLEDTNKVSHLSLFKNISVYTLKPNDSKEIKGSFICIDDHRHYLMNTTIETSSLKSVHAFASAERGKCSHFFKHLLQRVNPY